MSTWWARCRLPFKFLIGFVGITGSKSKGMEMLWDDAQRGLSTSVEARTVIALFLRREGKYKEAIEVVRSLKQQYPRDYLFCLEEANLLQGCRRRDGGGACLRTDCGGRQQAGIFCRGAAGTRLLRARRCTAGPASLCRSRACVRAGSRVRRAQERS